MSVIYREERSRDVRDSRDTRDRDWSNRSTAGGRQTTYRDSYDDRDRDRDRDRDGEGFSVKKVYRIPGRDLEDDRQSTYRSDDRYDRDRGGNREFTETRIVRRERTPEPEPEPERREIRITREERSRERAPEPRGYEREFRYERENDRLAPYNRSYEYDRAGDRDLQRYTREVEYYPRPDPPQPIIIRQEPQQIIIQEAPRAPVVVPEVT